MFKIEDGDVEAKVMADRSYVAEKAVDQISDMISHEAIQNDVVIQADTHPGQGSVIGFTKPLDERIVPNIVGVDVGCGMLGVKLGDELPLENEKREKRIRETVPMGRETNSSESSVDLTEEYPLEEANRKFEEFNESYKEKFGEEINPLEFDFDGYDSEYFEDLCDRVLPEGVDKEYVVEGAGSLGGGNHFIEFGETQKTGEYWCVIHSGSRFIGKSTAEYWQTKATKRRKATEARQTLENLPREYLDYTKFDLEDLSDEELLEWLESEKKPDFVDYEKLKNDYTGEDREMIQKISKELKEARPGKKRSSSLDWLEGREGHGYFVDMIFCQTYASWNREIMAERICDVLGTEPVDKIESTHNYIDFEDMIIRKGATPAREGERLIIPFNMADGTLICRGKGSEDHLYTAPHGAGRVMGRREAEEEIGMDEFKEVMDGIYSESVREETLDEAPSAYKDANYIKEKLTDTAEIEDHLEVVHNLKGF